MEAERGRKDPDQGSEVGVSMPGILQVYADLRISQDGVEIGITANGDEICVKTDFRSLISFRRGLIVSKSSVAIVDRVFRELGLTLRYQGKYLGFSILGSKADRRLVSLITFLLRAK
jgi:hypothetical protein